MQPALVLSLVLAAIAAGCTVAAPGPADGVGASAPRRVAYEDPAVAAFYRSSRYDRRINRFNTVIIQPVAVAPTARVDGAEGAARRFGESLRAAASGVSVVDAAAPDTLLVTTVLLRIPAAGDASPTGVEVTVAEAASGRFLFGFSDSRFESPEAAFRRWSQILYRKINAFREPV